MADITVTAAQVALIDPLKAEVYSVIAAEAITAGQVVFFDNTGKAQLADANAAGELQARGIALNAAGIGMAVDIVKRGRVPVHPPTSPTRTTAPPSTCPTPRARWPTT